MRAIIKQILDYLQHMTGFDYTAYRIEMLERRIEYRLVQTKIKNHQDYYASLLNSPEETTQLLDSCLINVSSFFRDSLSFEILNKAVIPKIISKKIKCGDNNIRIWSSACANGEEPYTLAILFHHYLKTEKINLEVNIYATDLDQTALKKAKLGIYPLESIQDVKLEFYSHYFNTFEDQVQICDEIKNMVTFSSYNLLSKNTYAPSESIFAEFDLILCRNILIYLKPHYQHQIFNKICKSLLEDSFLMLGESESIDSDSIKEFKQINSLSKIYKKV